MLIELLSVSQSKYSVISSPGISLTLSLTLSWIFLADVDLKTLVESPVVMKLGNKAILKVEKSELGTLIWTHDGELVDGKNPHYTFVNSNKTELEINAANLEQAGIYEVLLKEGGCEIRLKIEVQIEGLYFFGNYCDKKKFCEHFYPRNKEED